MDEWREALKAIESGSFKTETVVVESNKRWALYFVH